MVTPDSDAARLRAARDRAGLTVPTFAEQVGLSDASIFDLEEHDDELTSVYGPADLARLAAALGTSPAALLGIDPDGDVLSPEGLGAAVKASCGTTAIMVAAFEERAGWRVAASLDDPGRFRREFGLDGIRGVCRAAGVDWESFVRGL